MIYKFLYVAEVKSYYITPTYHQITIPHHHSAYDLPPLGNLQALESKHSFSLGIVYSFPLFITL